MKVPAPFASLLFSLPKTSAHWLLTISPILSPEAFQQQFTIHPISHLVVLLHLPSGKFPFILTSTSYWVPVAILIIILFLSTLLSVVSREAPVLVSLDLHG